MNKNEKEQQICLSCRECCEKLSFVVCSLKALKSDIEEIKNFYHTRGLVTHEDLKNNVLVVEVRQTCQFLSFEKGCLIYNRRPLSCRLYNGENDPTVNCKLKKKGQNLTFLEKEE